MGTCIVSITNAISQASQDRKGVHAIEIENVAKKALIYLYVLSGSN